MAFNPACPPIPRYTLLLLSFIAFMVLVVELALLIAVLRGAILRASTRAVTAGIASAAILLGIFTLALPAFMVFLTVQSNRFLLPPSCQILIGDTVAQRDLQVFGALEVVVVVLPLVGALVTTAAILFARSAPPRYAR